MLQKGRILLTLVVVLSAAIIVSDCVISLGAPVSPAGSLAELTAAGYSSSGLLLPCGRRYMGMARPDWLFREMAMRAQQGSGPIPDINLTPTATDSEELYASSAPYGELNRIVIASNGVDDDGDGRFDPGATADDFNLWMLRVDGSFATQLTQLAGDELYPAYDPGGRLVAFSSNAGGTWQIYTVEVLTGTIRTVTSGPGNKYEPTWSPDGNWIVFSGDLNGNRDLFIIPADGSLAPEAITTTPTDETQPDWAPSMAVATPIIFTRSGQGGSRIFGIAPDGSNETQLSTGGGDPAANDTDPKWRHNSSMITFASDRLTEGADTNRDYNIWTMSSSGEDVSDATLRSNLDVTDTYDDRYPTFNPGLNPRQPVRIFFTSWRSGSPDIWRLETSDPVPPELVDLPSVDNRYTTPGSDVTVYVPVFDRDTGVAQVVAEFKDPDSAVDDSQGIDHKQFGYSTGERWFNSGFDGMQAIELDCDTVGQTELFDDGDPAHGDAVAGDGIYSGKWTTPISPSDFIIDIHVQDNAGNAFEYDDIYGFTTEMFQPSSNLLFVDDYCEGQAFPANSGANNDWPTAFPVESYYTTNPGFVPDPFVGNIAYNTIRDGVNGRGFDGEPYDIWRIICRGPITMSDLIYYLPTREVQLTVPDLADTREVLVADRAVFWAAPHTGNTWVAPGSLVDATTQATLSTFLDRGGRLVLSGQDIGFALTLDGTIQNAFYTNYMHARYVNDDNHPGPETTINGVAGDPVAQEPWTRGIHYGTWADGGQDDQDYPLELHMPYDGSTSSHDGWNDGADAIEWPDGIEAVGGAVLCHSYDTGRGAGLHYVDQTTGYRVVYFAFDLASIHREYHSSGTPSTPHCRNYRSKLMHQTLCWLRTGGFQGRVVSISDGGQPVNDPAPIVRVIAGGQIVAAVQCEEDGRYVIGGLPPDYYELSAVRPGYSIDHYDDQFVHGGLRYRVVDFAISRAEPGAVRGTITSVATGDPVPTVQVCVYEALASEDEEEAAPAQDDGIEGYERGILYGCTTTAADGTYVIGDVTPGEVIVVADGTAIGYGEAEALATVTSGNTTTVDLALDAAPATIVATVTDTDGAAVQNATVEVLTDGTLAAQGVTDANGEVSISVPPGDYSVEATAPGYERSDPEAVSVAAGETENVLLVLQSEPPGSLSGMVSRALSGEPVGGVTVELVVNQAIIATTTTSATATVPHDGPAYNYRFDNVPTGQITVRPDPIGFTVTPSQRIVTVTSGQETTGVNFGVSAIRTFPAGLQLISLPYDYPNTDPATLLGADPATFKMAAWEPNDNRYHLYPATPADRFRLGTGYWLKLDQMRELSAEGVEAENTHAVSLQAGTGGWNIIGDFFLEPLDFYSLSVRDRNGVVRSMQQAMAAGLVRSPLFAYVLGSYTTSAVAEPYVGYWLNVGDDVTLIGDRATDTLAVGDAGSRPAITPPEGGWLLPLAVSSGGVCDAATWIGCAPAATDGFDAGLDLLKPPPPGMDSGVYAAAGDDAAYAVDVRAAAAGTTWTVNVLGPVGERVRVEWRDMSSLPAQVRPVLIDPATGAEVYMRTAQSYEFTAGEGARELQVRLLDGGAGLAVSVPAAVPAGAGAQISYTLSADAQVEVAVLNIAGRVVDTVVSDAMQSAGVQRVLWDGMTARGPRAPAGTYLVVVRARADNGQQTQSVGTMRLGR